MTNHVHLLITPHEEQSLSKALQILGRYYVQYFNHCMPHRTQSSACRHGSASIRIPLVELWLQCLKPDQ
ncbi:transposase [Nitrosospira sp. NpAV]|uniref:transposase n=1 Tax=Nitrosospira sp. NpAV TaxID=58133 RepID=UPI0018DD100C